MRQSGFAGLGAALFGTLLMTASCAADPQTTTPQKTQPNDDTDNHSDRALWVETYGGYAWSEDYARFRALVLEGEAAKASGLGEGFLDQAAIDLNYHNPAFGALAYEVGAAHYRAGHLADAFARLGQAQAAFLYYDSYAALRTVDVTALLAEVALALGRAEQAAQLYEQALAMAAVGGHDGARPALVAGLAEAYGTLDPRVGDAIKAARAEADAQ